VLLQKTLLNVEGLGRQLDPDLDLWVTAKPYLERWMLDYMGWRGLQRRLRDEAPFLLTTLPVLPRLIYDRLISPAPHIDPNTVLLVQSQRNMNRLLAVLVALAAVAIILWLTQRA
jgi:ubiquinone biosynthesis protein